MSGVRSMSAKEAELLRELTALRRQLAERAGNLLTISQMRNSEEATTENLQAHNAAVAALQALARGE